MVWQLKITILINLHLSLVGSTKWHICCVISRIATRLHKNVGNMQWACEATQSAPETALRD